MYAVDHKSEIYRHTSINDAAYWFLFDNVIPHSQTENEKEDVIEIDRLGL